MTVASRRWMTIAGASTRGAASVTSISPAACSVAFAMAGLVEVRNTSAASRPSSPPGQPSHACVTDSQKVSQSRSMRLSSAWVPGPLIRSQPRRAAAEQCEPAHPVRVSRRPGDRGHRRVIEAEERDLAGAGRRQDRIEVAQVRLERHVVDVALAPSRAAAVVLDQPDALAEPAVGALQDGDPPFRLEVRERHARHVDERLARIPTEDQAMRTPSLVVANRISGVIAEG